MRLSRFCGNILPPQETIALSLVLSFGRRKKARKNTSEASWKDYSRGVWREYALSVVDTFVRRHLSHGARHCTSVYTAVGECLGAPVVDYSHTVWREALEREQQATPLP